MAAISSLYFRKAKSLNDNQALTPVPAKILLPSREVAKQLSITTRTLFRLIAAGQFPRPLRLTPGSRSWVRWTQEDVHAYLDKLKSARVPNEIFSTVNRMGR